MAIRVLMVDDDINQLEGVKQYFSKSSSINVLKTCSNAQEAMSSLNDDFDVLVINMLLSGMDSMLILSKMKEMHLDKLIVATSEYISPDMMNSLSVYKPNYFVKKPYTYETLEKVVVSISNSKDNHQVIGDKDLKVAITDLLHSLGIPSHIKGYSYIRDGIEMMYKDESLIGSITKELYPNIASLYSTTSSRVERAIRHAIEVSWMRGDYNLMEELFGNSVDYDRAKPTNSEFIVTVADRLKLQNKYV